MKVLVKLVAAILITTLSVTWAGKINESLISAQESAVKTYKEKRTDKLSFKDVEKANTYVFEKGSNIEAIAKDLGLEYVIDNGKSVFHATIKDSEPIVWGSEVSEYGYNDLYRPIIKLDEYLAIDLQENLTNKELMKDNVQIKFLYEYLKRVENKKIKYNELIDDIKETAKKSEENTSDSYVRLDLADGLYAEFPNTSCMRVRINTVYGSRVIKKANQNITDYFLNVTNSKEAKDRVVAVYKSYCGQKEDLKEELKEKEEVNDIDSENTSDSEEVESEEDSDESEEDSDEYEEDSDESEDSSSYEEVNEHIYYDYDGDGVNDYQESGMDEYGFNWLIGCDTFKIDPEWGFGIGKFTYNETLYPDLSKDGDVYAMKFIIDLKDESEGDDVWEDGSDNFKLTPMECKVKSSKDALVIYDFINKIYDGKYPLSKDEFVSRYVKYYLAYRLDLFRDNYGYWLMSPGVSFMQLYENRIRLEIPLSFTK